ncbi:phage recombination protein Bet [Leucobacter sp. OH1287]|uniref:phage recombination protein Bet n=1 Tax=Leucobacter sp. OH1287 TaxID=2491049 RepID=UPI00131506C3|nr:phage recombination protein Bet [Leucobacter sp. OH1287]
MSEIVKAAGASELVIDSGQTFFNEVQQAALRSMGLSDAPRAEVEKFFHQAQRTGLDPFTRQIYMIPRYSKGNGKTWTVQISIDGLRLIRDRKNTFRGMEEFWCGEDGVWRDVWVADAPPVAAKVLIWVDGFVKPVSAVARYREYAPLNKQGQPTSMWAKMPALMTAKVAEALALRKAYPNDLSGLYTAEEMAQADNAAHAPASASTSATVQAQTVPAAEPPAPTVEQLEIVHSLIDRAAAAVDNGDLEALRTVWDDASAAGVMQVTLNGSSVHAALLEAKARIDAGSA